MKILGISGSPTATSRSTWLTQTLLGLLADGIDQSEVLETIDVRTLDPVALIHADASAPSIKSAIDRVAQADLVVVSTPVYKASYSGLLKVFLDLLPQDGLRGKAVLPLATGGSIAHLLAVDYALKPVLSALGARNFFDSIYGTDAQFTRHAVGVYDIDTALTGRLSQVQSDVTQWSRGAQRAGAAIDISCPA